MNSIMLIGAMKSGTTTLYNHLIKHPEICGGVSKEPEYFSEKMGFAKYKGGMYEDLFKCDLAVHKYRLDGSTGYTKYPAEQGVAQRMKDYGLNPFFIYIIRNPIDRIKSHYNFMKGDVNWQGKLDSPNLVHTSMYFMQLEEYAKVFTKERILVLDFDELKRDPSGLCKRVFEFVGAGNFQLPQEENGVRNKTKPENRTKAHITNQLSGYGRFFPGFLKRGVREGLKRAFPAKETKLTKDQEERFRAELVEDMDKLKSSYGVDVRKWGF